jgi:hypothetical protein
VSHGSAADALDQGPEMVVVAVDGGPKARRRSGKS